MTATVSTYRLNGPLQLACYLKSCDSLTEVKQLMLMLKQQRMPPDQLSVLGSLAVFSAQELEQATRSLSAFTSTAIHLLHTADAGTVFVAGALSGLLLEKIDGKALGSLEGGLQGILNAIDHRKSSSCLEQLQKGKIMVIAWRYALENKHETAKPAGQD